MHLLHSSAHCLLFSLPSHRFQNSHNEIIHEQWQISWVFLSSSLTRPLCCIWRHRSAPPSWSCSKVRDCILCGSASFNLSSSVSFMGFSACSLLFPWLWGCWTLWSFQPQLLCSLLSDLIFSSDMFPKPYLKTDSFLVDICLNLDAQHPKQTPSSFPLNWLCPLFLSFPNQLLTLLLARSPKLETWKVRNLISPYPLPKIFHLIHA